MQVNASVSDGLIFELASHIGPPVREVEDVEDGVCDYSGDQRTGSVRHSAEHQAANKEMD